MNIQAVSLDVTKKPNALPVIRLRQGDKNGTTIVASIFDDGEPLPLSGKAVKFAMQSPDGAAYYDVDGSTSGNVATFEIDETYACAITGVTDKAYVKVLEGTTVICSTNRILVVIFESAEEGADPEQSYSSGIAEATNRANAAAEAAEGVILQAVPLMSATVRGGAQLGDGLSIVDGKLTADGSAYELPTMGASTKGGAKLGGGLSIANDALSVSPVTTAQVDGIIADTAVTGDESLSATGLAYFWGKLKAWAAAAFAAISHSHQASDITSGTLSVERGGTGAATAADARTGLGVYSAGEVDAALSGKVSKSGDTMSGALTVEADDLNLKSDNLDIDTAPAAQTIGDSKLQFLDKDGNRLGLLQPYQNANGGNVTGLYAFNKTANDENVQTQINLYAFPDGTHSYYINDTEAFCAAIHVGDFVSKDQTTAVSMANSGYTNVTSINLTAGVWVVYANIAWASNATGRRYAYISTASQSTVASRTASCNAVNGGATYQNVAGIVSIGSATTFYLVGWQNSGAALNATGYLRAVRIK